MKKNDLAQIKNLDIGELVNKAKVLREEIAKGILDQNMKKLKNLKQVNKKKKDLAQVLTVLRQKQLMEELESEVDDKKQGSRKTRNNKETQKPSVFPKLLRLRGAKGGKS